jgi:hypothetical protein
VLCQLSYTPVEPECYFASLWRVCLRQRGQNLLSSIRFGSFFLFFRVVYVRSLHSVQASWNVGRASTLAIDYSVMLVRAPAPTVRPPSRMAKRWPTSRAIGVMSSTPISTLSPGMTISAPSGRVIAPVTSVVRR